MYVVTKNRSELNEIYQSFPEQEKYAGLVDLICGNFVEYRVVVNLKNGNWYYDGVFKDTKWQIISFEEWKLLRDLGTKNVCID